MVTLFLNAQQQQQQITHGYLISKMLNNNNK